MKHYYMILDTETTAENTVADIGAVIVDRKGIVHDSLGALVIDQFDRVDMHRALGNPKMVKAKYMRMLDDGLRVMASVPAINTWLSKTAAKYKPVLTAYNISFDINVCNNTNIDLSCLPRRFCLMKAAQQIICSTDNYNQWCIDNNELTPTGRNKTSADAVARYLDCTLPAEPHTALEDARDYEGVILNHIINAPKTQREIIAAGQPKGAAKWLKV